MDRSDPATIVVFCVTTLFPLTWSAGSLDTSRRVWRTPGCGVESVNVAVVRSSSTKAGRAQVTTAAGPPAGEAAGRGPQVNPPDTAVSVVPVGTVICKKLPAGAVSGPSLPTVAVNCTDPPAG